MANGKVEKIIEFKAAQAVSQLDQVIKRLNKTNETLAKLERQANAINFEKFIPSINKFANSFSKIKIDPQNLNNIQLMAQALNRFRMTATELNKKGVDVTFVKVTKAVYSFSDSISRMNLLNESISKIASLGLAINRLVNSSMKLQNMKVSFTSLTQAIYAFVGSILRIKDLDNVITKLERLGNALEKLRTNIARLSGRGINRIINFVDSEGLKKKLSVTQEKVRSLKDEIKRLKEEAKNVSAPLSKFQTAIQKIGDSLNTMTSYFRISMLRSLFYTMQRLGRWIYDVTRAYASYVENINLATVAYYGLEEAAKSLYPFVEKISIAFGLNESEVIRAVGLFKQMANAMQLTQEQGDLLSTGLTKMAYDISSLYNITFDRAISALQSALVGQTKPIRSATGADITENTLRLTLQDLNIGKEIRELSFVEKRLIMVISLTKQLANAQGDLANTIESPANQLKVLSQQLERLKIALGEFFEIGMNYILPLLNGIVMALVVIVETFTEFVKQLIGYEEDTFNYDGLQGVNDQVNDLIDGMEEANKEAEELEKHLLGIDELNIIDPNSTITTNGIDPAILDAFNAALENWDNKMDEVSMKAYKIRDIILSWFGLEQENDGKWGLKEGESLARTIAETLASIDLSKFMTDLGEILSVFGKLLLYSLALRVILSPFTWLAAGLYLLLDGINVELFDGENILREWEKILLGLTLLIGGAALLFRSWNLGLIALTMFGIYMIAKGLNGLILDGVWNWEDMRTVLFGIGTVLLAFGIITKDWILLAMAGIAILGAASLKQLTGFKQRFQEGTTSILDWLSLIFMGLLYSIIWVIEAVIKIVLLAITLPFTLLFDFVAAIGLGLIAILEGVVDLIVGVINTILGVVNALTGSKLRIQIDNFSTTKNALKKYADQGGFTTPTWVKTVVSAGVASSIDDAVMDAIHSNPEIANPESNLTSSSTSFDEMVGELGDILATSKETNKISSVQLGEQQKLNDIQNTSNALIKDFATAYENMSEEDRKRILNNTYAMPYTAHANGGYPSKGLFLMNEGNSAEMLGSIGGKTAVVNNEQIASALAQALTPLLGTVVSAVENVAANDRPIVLNVDSRQMARANQKGSQKLGYNQIGGEFANV